MSVKRLIDANALDKKLWDRHYPYAQTKAELHVRKMIREAPDIEAVPVVHGWWMRAAGKLHIWYCSACGEKINYV